MEGEDFDRFEVNQNVLPIQIHTCEKLAHIWLRHWLLQTHAPFCPAPDDPNRTVVVYYIMCGGSIGWLYQCILPAHFIDEEEESLLQFGKPFLSPVFIYASTRQSFPHHIAKFTDSPKFSPTTVSRYTVVLKYVYMCMLYVRCSMRTRQCQVVSWWRLCMCDCALCRFL